MRRALAAAVLAVTAVTAVAAPAGAAPPDVKQLVTDLLGTLDECMDCIPGRCQILNSCEVQEDVAKLIHWP